MRWVVIVLARTCRRHSTLALIILLVAPCRSGGSQQHAAGWQLFGDRAAFTMEASGEVTGAGGVALSLKCVNPQSTGSATLHTRLDAAPYRLHRVTLSADMQTVAVKGGARFYLATDRFVQTALQAEQDQPLRGDMAWTTVRLSLPVPADTVGIVFGVTLMPGGGSVAVRNLKVEVGRAFTGNEPMAPDARGVLDAAISTVKAKALRADSLDWTTVERQVRSYAAGAERSSDAYPAIRYLLAALGDRHSFFMPPAATSQFKSSGAQNPPADVRPLPDGIGYIGVSAYSGVDPDAGRAYARRAHESLVTVKPSAVCGWVVDLRTNGGGNMWPMLAGLKPLLGDGVLGSFRQRTGQTEEWTASDPRFAIAPPTALNDLYSAWVAVLTGPRTASSGEFVTIAFRGRPRTRSFGMPTAGLSTGNATFPLPDGSQILLTTTVGADRTGVRYGRKIEPDEVINEGGQAQTAGDDTTLAAAVRWLKQASGCGKS